MEKYTKNAEDNQLASATANALPWTFSRVRIWYSMPSSEFFGLWWPAYA